MAQVHWGWDLSFEGRPFVMLLVPWPPGVQARVWCPAHHGGSFRMALLFSACEAVDSGAMDIWQFCRARNGVLSSRGEHVGGFRHRRFGSVPLRASLPPCRIKQPESFGPWILIWAWNVIPWGEMGRKEWPLTVFPY